MLSYLRPRHIVSSLRRALTSTKIGKPLLKLKLDFFWKIAATDVGAALRFQASGISYWQCSVNVVLRH